MSVTVGAAIAITGGVAVVGGSSLLLFTALARRITKLGLAVNTAGMPWHGESDQELNRRTAQADARLFARLRRYRPYALCTIGIGAALVVAGGLVDSGAL